MRKWLGYVAAILLAAPALPALPALAAPEAPYDLVIRNGHIIDGTGSPWYAGDVGIRDGRIAAIGDARRGAPAKRTIDAGGQGRRARASSTCWASRSSPSWSIRACRRRSSRGSPPRSPARAARPRRSTTPSSRPTSWATSTSSSPPTGARSASTSPGSRSRGSGSTSRATSAPPRCGGWCSATTNRAADAGRAGADAGAWCARRWSRARSASRPRCSIRRRPTPRPRS